MERGFLSSRAREYSAENVHLWSARPTVRGRVRAPALGFCDRLVRSTVGRAVLGAASAAQEVADRPGEHHAVHFHPPVLAHVGGSLWPRFTPPLPSAPLVRDYGPLFRLCLQIKVSSVRPKGHIVADARCTPAPSPAVRPFHRPFPHPLLFPPFPNTTLPLHAYRAPVFHSFCMLTCKLLARSTSASRRSTRRAAASDSRSSSRS